MLKINFKNELKGIYDCQAKEPIIITVSKMNYLMIDGKGDPNTEKAYSEAIEALFGISYALKFMVKKGPMEIDYGVLPLEGLWWTENGATIKMNNKDDWYWTAMIMQPEFITKDLIDKAIEQTIKKKKDIPALSKLRFEALVEGRCAQIMHIGPYVDEEPTIERLHRFIVENGYRFNGKHHELYLSDVRRAAPEKLKMIIRQPVKK